MSTQKRNKDWVQEFFFLIIPEPLEDELLSSWLTRVAIAHKRSLSVFLSLFIRRQGHEITSVDIDFKYDKKLFEQLSFKSTLPLKRIQEMSLRSEEGYLFACNDCLYPPKQIRKLVDRRTHNGLMFCPHCLKEDNIPYFRKQWRYFFYNACLKHKVFLTDRCWCCYKRVNIAKITHMKQLSLCKYCEKDLSTTLTVAVYSNYEYGLKAIEWFAEGLRSGYFIIDNEKVTSLFIFESFTFLSYLLDRKEELVLDSFPMIQEYKKICEKQNKYNSTKATSVKKDFVITSLVYHLFQNFPNNFIEFAKNNNLTHRDFLHGFKDIPFWYKNLIDNLIPIQNKMGREIVESEVTGAINYLKRMNIKPTQEEVAKIVGCHFTIHKGFVRINKKLIT